MSTNDQKPTYDQLEAANIAMQNENRLLNNMVLKEVKAHQDTRDAVGQLQGQLLQLSAQLDATMQKPKPKPRAPRKAAGDKKAK